MRRTFLIAATVVLALGGESEAREWYFSSCPSGCAAARCDDPARAGGTLGNPFCLDPGGDGGRESLVYLFDGKAPEAAPGDVISLCAGEGPDPCRDRVHAATLHVDPARCALQPPRCRPGIDRGCSVETVWFDALYDAPGARPYVIRALPGETIVISGDSDGDGVHDPSTSCSAPGDVGTLIRAAAPERAARGGHVFQDLIFEKSGGRMIELSNPRDWRFERCTLRYSGAPMWSGIARLPRDLYDPDDARDCSKSDGDRAQSHALKVTNLRDGRFTFRDGVIHSACGFAHRNVSNEEGGGEFLFENNEYYNVGAVNNDFLNWTFADDRGARFTWRGNDIHDCRRGLSIEDRNRHWLVEDNTIACVGSHQVQAHGRCDVAISVNDGDLGQGGTTADIVIRNNRIQASAAIPALEPARCSAAPGRCGWFLAAIVWEARCANNAGCEKGGKRPAPWACCTGAGTGTCDVASACVASAGVIEGNVVRGHRSAASGLCERAGICVRSNNGGIRIVRNVVDDAEHGIVLDAAVPGVAYEVTGNVCARARPGPEMLVLANAARSAIDGNIFVPGRRGDVLRVAGAGGFKCDGRGSVGRFRRGNRCADASVLEAHVPGSTTPGAPVSERARRRPVRPGEP